MYFASDQTIQRGASCRGAGTELLENFGETKFGWNACYCAHHTNIPIMLLFAFRWRH